MWVEFGTLTPPTLAHRGALSHDFRLASHCAELEAYIREFSKTGGIYHEEVALLAIHSSADVWIGLLTAEGQSTE